MILEIATDDLIPLRRLLVEQRDQLRAAGERHQTWDLVCDDVDLLNKVIGKLNRAIALLKVSGAGTRRNRLRLVQAVRFEEYVTR